MRAATDVIAAAAALALVAGAASPAAAATVNPGAFAGSTYIGPSALTAPGTMPGGRYMLSADGRYGVVMQPDYGPGYHLLWSTHSFGAGARRKNRRAASASRSAETSTSTTCPYWSTARYTYRHTPLTLTYVSSACHLSRAAAGRQDSPRRAPV